jgi:hypothetical protein
MFLFKYKGRSLKNSIIISVNFLFAFLVSVMITYIYWKMNYQVLDTYTSFIYGDTINGLNNKKIDTQLLPIFAILFIVIFAILEKFNIFSKIFNLLSSIKKQNSDFSYISLFLKVVLAVIFSYISIKLLISIEILDITRKRYIYLASLIVFLVSISFKKRFLLVSQLLFSLSPLLFLTESYIYNNEKLSFEFNNSYIYFIYSLVIILFFSSIKEIIKNKGYILSSTIVFIITLYLGGITRIYELDEYHIGELFTPFHQLFILGQSAYSEFIPTKGFMHVAVGFLNNIFFDGGYITISSVSKIFALLTGIFLVLFLKYFYSKEKILLFFLLLMPISWDYYPILIGLVLLSNEKIIKNPINFIIAYSFFSLVYFFYYNAFAIAFAISVLPLFLYYSYYGIKHKLKINLLQYSLIFIFLSLLIYFNELIYYSIKYSLYYGSYEKFLTSNLWIFSWIVLATYLYKNFKRLENDRLLWILFFIIYPFVIHSYLEGRADRVFARALNFSYYYSFLLFVYLVTFYKRENKIFMLLLFSTLLLPFIFNSKIPYLNLKSIINFDRFSAITINSTSSEFVKNSDIPNLGQGFIEKSRLLDLQKEYQLINILNTDENFLIIDPYVSQSARYSIFDKKVPTKSHSVLNISSLNSQSDELKKLKDSNVKIIRITEGINRYHIFHRYIFSLDFISITYNNKIFLISKDIIDRIPENLEFSVNENILEQFSVKNFDLLPIKWGSAFSKESKHLEILNTKLDVISTNDVTSINTNSYKLGDKDPFVVYEFRENYSLPTSDMITIELEGIKKDKCLAQLFWRSNENFSEKNSIKFQISNGYNVVPIGMNLDWKETSNLKNIRLDIDNCNNETIEIKKLLFVNYLYN